MKNITITATIIKTHDLPADRVDHWNTLTAEEQTTHYHNGQYEIRVRNGNEAAYGSLIGGYRGKGASLAEAVDQAWNAKVKAEQFAQAEAEEASSSDIDHAEYMVWWEGQRAARKAKMAQYNI